MNSKRYFNMKLPAKLSIDESASTSRENSDVPKDSPTKDKEQSLIETINILDGSIVTEIDRYISMGNFLEIYMYHLYNYIEPIIRQIHENFLNAGANVIRTNTTYAYPFIIYQEGQYSEETYRTIIGNAVEVANKAVTIHNNKSSFSRKQAMVVGTCACFDPPTKMTEDRIKNEYKCLIKALSDAGVNTFCLQDIKRSYEANMLVELLKELQTEETKALMMFKPNTSGFLEDQTVWIDTAVQCYNEITLMAVGINCMSPLDALIEVERFRDRQEQIPLVVCSDKDRNEEEWQPVGLTYLLPSQWADLKIDYLGGCCNVGSSSLKYIREQLEIYNDMRLET